MHVDIVVDIGVAAAVAVAIVVESQLCLGQMYRNHILPGLRSAI